MRCKDVKRLIYLKKDELTFNEQQFLTEHVKQCEFCRIERDRFEKQILIAETLKESPHLDQPDALTSDIMRSIRFLEKFSKRRSNPLDKLLDVFALKPIRVVFASSIILVVALFFTQEMIILNRLNTMEQRLTQQGTPPTVGVYAETAKSVLMLLGKKENQLVIDRELLENLLNSYGELQTKNRILLRVLEEQAEQANITWQDGLTDDELQSLLQRETVQQKLKEL